MAHTKDNFGIFGVTVTAKPFKNYTQYEQMTIKQWLDFAGRKKRVILINLLYVSWLQNALKKQKQKERRRIIITRMEAEEKEDEIEVGEEEEWGGGVG